jgi:hypothetical protein
MKGALRNESCQEVGDEKEQPQRFQFDAVSQEKPIGYQGAGHPGAEVVYDR